MAQAKMTTYELNQQAYKNIDPLDDKTIQEKKQELTEGFENCAASSYMGLLCRELNDYTVFHTNGKYVATAEEVIDVLQTRGKILDLTYVIDGYSEAYQCWVSNSVITEEQAKLLNTDMPEPNIHMYMLFNAEDWVIEV